MSIYMTESCLFPGAHFDRYLSTLPDSVLPYLDKELDLDNDFDRDLVKIANSLLNWEEFLSAPFRLTPSNISDIKTRQQSPELQRYCKIDYMYWAFYVRIILCRREVLRTWQSNFGFDATYRNLLKILVNTNHTNGAKAVRRVLKRLGKIAWVCCLYSFLRHCLSGIQLLIITHSHDFQALPALHVSTDQLMVWSTVSSSYS